MAQKHIKTDAQRADVKKSKAKTAKTIKTERDKIVSLMTLEKRVRALEDLFLNVPE